MRVEQERRGRPSYDVIVKTRVDVGFVATLPPRALHPIDRPHVHAVGNVMGDDVGGTKGHRAWAGERSLHDWIYIFANSGVAAFADVVANASAQLLFSKATRCVGFSSVRRSRRSRCSWSEARGFAMLGLPNPPLSLYRSCIQGAAAPEQRVRSPRPARGPPRQRCTE